MSNVKRNLTIIILLSICLSLVVLVRSRTEGMHERWKEHERQQEKSLVGPRHSSSAVVLEFLGSGIEPLIADFYWVRVTTMKADELFEMRKRMAVQGLPKMMGHLHLDNSDEELIEMYDLLRNVTLFDPEFEYAYFFGAHLLSFDGQPDLAISLLEYGLRKNPDSGMIPSLLAFIYFYFKGHDFFDTAAQYAELSYRNSGKYSSMYKEVSNFYAAGNNYDFAIEFLRDVLKQEHDENTKSEIEEQLKYLYVEKHISDLQDLVDRYTEYYWGEKPENLEVFVDIGFIKEIPQEPFGGKYLIDEEGQVVNEPYNRFEHFKNLRNHIPKEGMKFEDTDRPGHKHDPENDHHHDHDHGHDHDH